VSKPKLRVPEPDFQLEGLTQLTSAAPGNPDGPELWMELAVQDKDGVKKRLFGSFAEMQRLADHIQLLYENWWKEVKSLGKRDLVVVESKPVAFVSVEEDRSI
jgi:hypothetical protein